MGHPVILSVLYVTPPLTTHLCGNVLDELRHGRDDEDAVGDGDVEVVEVHAHHEPHQRSHHEGRRHALQCKVEVLWFRFFAESEPEL